MESYKTNGYGKICFCVGPENCNDKECKLVKDYLERKNKMLRKFKTINMGSNVCVFPTRFK